MDIDIGTTAAAVRVTSGCLAVTYIEPTAVILECLDGTCDFSTQFGSDYVNLPAGQRVRIDTQSLEVDGPTVIQASDVYTKYYGLLQASPQASRRARRATCPPRLRRPPARCLGQRPPCRPRRRRQASALRTTTTAQTPVGRRRRQPARLVRRPRQRPTAATTRVPTNTPVPTATSTVPAAPTSTRTALPTATPTDVATDTPVPPTLTRTSPPPTFTRTNPPPTPARTTPPGYRHADVASAAHVDRHAASATHVDGYAASAASHGYAGAALTDTGLTRAVLIRIKTPGVQHAGRAFLVNVSGSG